MTLVRVNAVQLETQTIAGSAGLAPIVFLHEGLGSLAMWRDWPQQVCRATGRSGLVYSRRGYGRSDAITEVRTAHRLSSDYMQREAWDVLPELLATLGIERPVLLGHSDGATIALLHASRWPVQACIAMAPHVFVEELSLAAIARARALYEDTGSGLRERLARYHDDVDCAFWQWNDVWLSAAFRDFDIRMDCARIAAPLLVVQGLEDEYGSLAQIEEIARAAPQARLLKLENCGHSPQRDRGREVVEAVRRFLEGVASGEKI
jgi:pimeloyl-ACP methyl ester carboxylesterase